MLLRLVGATSQLSIQTRQSTRRGPCHIMPRPATPTRRLGDRRPSSIRPRRRGTGIGARRGSSAKPFIVFCFSMYRDGAPPHEEDTGLYPLSEPVLLYLPSAGLPAVAHDVTPHRPASRGSPLPRWGVPRPASRAWTVPSRASITRPRRAPRRRRFRERDRMGSQPTPTPRHATQPIYLARSP